MMAHHIEIGKKGEALATDYLVLIGFKILQANWRYSHYEIDIIAMREGVLHFIEIKTRVGDKYGYPEESVSVRKIESLMRGAAAYLRLHPSRNRIQFDVLSITLGEDKDPEYFFIEDVSC